MISTLTESRPPYSHRTRGYIMLVPRYLNPPISWKGYTLYLGYWLPLAVTQSSGDYTAKIPPFPRKWEYACGPSCIRLGAGDRKTPPFPGFLGKIFPRLLPKIPPFPRKWEYACSPLIHSCGGRGQSDKVSLKICECTRPIMPRSMHAK